MTDLKQELLIPDCLPLAETEVLTPQGWVGMDRWAGQQIMITTEDGELRFEAPQAFLKKGTEAVYTFSSGPQQLSTTAGHRNLVRWAKPGGPIRTSIRLTSELVGVQNVALPVAGRRHDGLAVDARLLTLIGFCLGDGTRDTDNWKINVKRPRKIAFLDKLFDESDMTRNVAGDYVVYRLRAGLTAEVDKWLGSDKAPAWEQWLALDADSIEAALTGILEADGTRHRSKTGVAFHAVRPAHIDLVQTLAIQVGYRVTRLQPHNNSKSTFASERPLLGLYLSQTPRASRQGQYGTSTRQAEVGCFAVSTGAFVVRQGGHVWLTGNCHIPYEDRRAYDLMLWVASELQDGRGPDGVTILGDYADFYAVNGHGRKANMERHLQREVDAVNARLDELETLFPHATKKFIQGNHCWRLERYIDAKAPELFGVTDTQKILRLESRGWDYVPYTPDQLTQIGKSKLYARHEPLQGGTLPAHGTAIKAGCSVVYGHIHTIQQSQVVMANGDEHLGISVGWLGDKSKDAFDYVKGHHQWSLGFGVCTWDPKTGLFFVDTVRIFDYQCFFGDKWYHG